MKKYSQGEGNLEVLRGEEAVVVNEHLSKTGKAVSDFNENERQALHADLDRVRPKQDVAEENSAKESSSDSEKESE
jgi:hypothetical protein